MKALQLILFILLMVFSTVRGWASAAATLTNHNLLYFQIDALPTAIPTNVIKLTGNLTNWQKLVTNVICNPCLTINPTDLFVPYRINATTFGDSLISYQDDATTWVTATNLVNDAHFALRSTGTNCGSAFYSMSLSDSSGVQDVVWLNGLKGGTWGAGTPATRSGVFSINTLYHNSMFERFEIDGDLGTIKMFDKTGVQNFQLSDVSGYTGTGTNYLSDDGTYKPCCASGGATINPSDTFVPYRINGTTFGDSWWYYTANGMGIDTNILQNAYRDATGTNYVRLKQGWNQTDQAFVSDIQSLTNNTTGVGVPIHWKIGGTNYFDMDIESGGSILPKFTVNNPAGDYLGLSLIGTSAPHLVANTAIFVDQALVTKNLVPDSDNSRDIGTSTSNGAYKDLWQKGSHYLESFNDGLGTNDVWMRARMVNRDAVFDMRSVTNNVSGVMGDFLFKTNTVTVASFKANGALTTGGDTNQWIFKGLTVDAGVTNAHATINGTNIFWAVNPE